MAFSIRFLPESCQRIERDPVMEAVGQIVLAEFSELFVASLSFWTKAQYEAHWKEALKRIVGNASPSSLITTIYDPAVANFIFWWPMYRHDDKILVHNHMLLLMEVEERFDPKNPYRLIPRYENVDEEGQRISEWKISVGDISTFLGQSG